MASPEFGSDMPRRHFVKLFLDLSGRPGAKVRGRRVCAISPDAVETGGYHLAHIVERCFAGQTARFRSATWQTTKCADWTAPSCQPGI